MQDIVGGTDLLIYNVSNGAANYEGIYQYRRGYCAEDSSTFDYCDLDGSYKTASRSELIQKGWEIDEYGNADCLFYNGKKVDRTFENVMRSYDNIAYYDYDGYLQIEFTPVQTMLNAFDTMLSNKVSAPTTQDRTDSTSSSTNAPDPVYYVKVVDGTLNVRVNRNTTVT